MNLEGAETTVTPEERTFVLTRVEKTLAVLLVILIVAVVGLTLVVSRGNREIDTVHEVTIKIDEAASETQRIVHNFEERALASQACQPGSTTPTTVGQCDGAANGAAVFEGLQAIKRIELTLNDLKKQLEEQE